jgi:hypothetical protein
MMWMKDIDRDKIYKKVEGQTSKIRVIRRWRGRGHDKRDKKDEGQRPRGGATEKKTRRMIRWRDRDQDTVRGMRMWMNRDQDKPGRGNGRGRLKHERELTCILSLCDLTGWMSLL